MMHSYLFQFAQVHHEFRLPELSSIAELHGFSLSLPPQPEHRDPTRPFMVIGLEDEEHARILARRCILIKYVVAYASAQISVSYRLNIYLKNRSVFVFYGQGSNYDELHAANRTHQDEWLRFARDTSFRFLVTAYNHKIPQTRQREVIESFSYMGFLGKIDLKNPDIILTCFEECALHLLPNLICLPHEF